MSPQYIRTVVFAASIAAAIAPTIGFAEADSKLNILLIAVDDLNDWIGCLGGHPQARTPNIDRLAAHGVLFTNADCQSPVCNPSHDSLMASLYPGNYAIRSERYRYIHYNDGSEEFYDHADDPHEWKNLIPNSDSASLVDEHRAFLPKTSHVILGSGSTGHAAYNASEAAK